MKKDRSSITAEQMALSRALESKRPEPTRICYDQYAKRFLGFGYTILTSNKFLRRHTERGIERWFPGHHHYVIARTRFIDDCLQERVETGIKQLVVLGAGFDSRAYRFREKLCETKIFEVDHPATQKAKREKLKKILDAIPRNVVYLPIDFSQETLEKTLPAKGYDNAVNTFFIWEGTTPYLTTAAIDETLAFVSSNSANGSSIVFDYLLRSVVKGTCEWEDALKEFKYMAGTSEPFITGFESETISAFLGERGFGRVNDIGGDELMKAVLGDSGRNIRIKPWWRIVHASVDPNAAVKP